jgi:hypothetical protein
MASVLPRFGPITEEDGIPQGQVTRPAPAGRARRDRSEERAFGGLHALHAPRRP